MSTKTCVYPLPLIDRCYIVIMFICSRSKFENLHYKYKEVFAFALLTEHVQPCLMLFLAMQLLFVTNSNPSETQHLSSRSQSTGPGLNFRFLQPKYKCTRNIVYFVKL